MQSVINPTRMELNKYKRRRATAVRGHKLLKDKQDEMARRFIESVRRNIALRGIVEEKLAKAMAQSAKAAARMGEEALGEALMVPSRSATVERGERNIMSVRCPTFSLSSDSGVALLPYGFAFTSGDLDSAVLALADVLPDLIELASVEKTCDMLACEMEKTRRRVNALEYVMIPEMEEAIKYITMKLEDNERSNTTRLMKIKDQKLKNQ